MTDVSAPPRPTARIDLVDRALADFRVRKLELEPAFFEHERLSAALEALDQALAAVPKPGRRRGRPPGSKNATRR